MMHRLASLGAGLALAVLALSGCFTQPSDGVFGPANSLGGDENDSPALSLQASPARGPGPLEVEFSLSALDRDGGPLTWSLDFGDRTAPAAGGELPAQPRHTYMAPGAYVARFTVKGSGEGETFVSTISIVVLEGLVPEASPTQGPEPPQYSPPPSGGGSAGGDGGPVGGSSSSSQTTSASTSSSTGGTSTGPPDGNSSASQTSSSTSTSEEPTPSETSTGSDTGTSSSTGTETFSDPGTSSSQTSTEPPPEEPEPTPSESESETQTSDPPL